MQTSYHFNLKTAKFQSFLWHNPLVSNYALPKPQKGQKMKDNTQTGSPSESQKQHNGWKFFFLILAVVLAAVG